jgi:hypothetical protein
MLFRSQSYRNTFTQPIIVFLFRFFYLCMSGLLSKQFISICSFQFRLVYPNFAMFEAPSTVKMAKMNIRTKAQPVESFDFVLNCEVKVTFDFFCSKNRFLK